MPEKVQSIPGADPQIEEIVKDTVSASKGGTHYGAETFKGAVAFEGLVTLTTLANLAIDLILKKANPALRLIGTEGSAKDWRIVEDAGAVKVQENTGSEGSPTWTTRFSVDATGITAGEKDPTSGSLVHAETILTSGSITTTSTTYVDATGLSVTLTTGAHRVLICGNISAKCPGNTLSLSIDIDGTQYPASNAVSFLAGFTGGGATLDFLPSNFAFVSPVLSAASHTIKVKWKVGGGTGTIGASTAIPATLQVTELPLAA